MATIRLVPSELYNAAGTSYLSVTNQTNAFTDTDSDTYATISNLTASTNSRYIYLRGFNWNDIPDGAVINSFSIKLKARQTGGSTSSNYRPLICKGTATYSNAYCSAITTSASVHEFSFTQDFNTFRDDGDEFGIRINCRRNSRNTAASFYIYGAEIEVDYTVPDPAVVTSALTGDGTIEPEGVKNTFVDESYTITITPTDKSEPVTITNNGTDVTSELIPHYAGGLKSYTAESYTTGGSIDNGENYLGYPVGHTAENPHTYSTNVYASDYSTGYAIYSFDMSDIPSNAVIESVEVRASGRRENASVDSTHVADVDLYSGSTLKVESHFTSTSDHVITIDGGSWTRAELQNAKVRFTVGYYGGRLYGITWEVTFSIPGSNPEYYTYTYTVNGDATIAVVIGTQETSKLYLKINGAWVEVECYKKINGTWTLQDPADVLDTDTKYVHHAV